MNLEKVYKVEFMEYTNACRDTVSDWDGVSSHFGTTNYLKTSSESFLLTESQLDRYNKYGRGYRSIQFVGFLPID